MINTLRLGPPPGAQVLFNGKDLIGWVTQGGKPAVWQVEDEVVTVAPGRSDMITQARFGDFFLHLEFCCPDMPNASGQNKANSGVFLQGRYEVQILDSYGVSVPGKDDCGALYGQYAPLMNATKRAGEWQTFDVFFRAARQTESIITQARVTLLHNGVVIHNNVELQGATRGALDEQIDEPGPLRLQDHGDRVGFRNIWILPLSETSLSSYKPR